MKGNIRTTPSPPDSGFTLLEIILGIGISSLIFGTIFLAYHVYLDTYDHQLVDTRMWVDLREAAESMKRDLRDASSVTFPPGGSLLITFTLKNDGLTYSYYLNSNNALIRQQGTSGSGGRTLAENLDPIKTGVSQAGGLYTFTLVATVGGQTARITTSARPRNI